MVLANGSVAVFSQNDVELKAVAVGLGAFGVLTQVELCVEPTFNITTHVFLKYYEKFTKCDFCIVKYANPKIS